MTTASLIRFYNSLFLVCAFSANQIAFDQTLSDIRQLFECGIISAENRVETI